MKRLFAIVLCFALILTCFTGCHEKGETAVTIGDVKFTSGYYACALIFADTEARSNVEAELTEEESTTNIDYWSHKIEDTDYVKWVEKTALDTLKEIASVKALCEKAGVTLSEDTLALAESNAQYFWDSYGYSEIMEPNGVSEATFTQYMQDSYLMDEYFNHLYGKDGEKAISAETLQKQLSENYLLANMLDVSFDGMSETEKKETREQFVAYETALKDGSKTFEQIYLEYYGESEESHTHEEPEEGELAPQDHHASVMGSDDTDYSSVHYEAAKAMAVGEIKLVTLDDEAGLVLLVKKDIMADPYYIEELDTTLRKDIEGDNFDKEVEEQAKKAESDINTFSTKQFKVKKLVYPDAQ